MLGLIVALVLSWAILWLITKEHLTILGITPSGKRIAEFFGGLIFMAAMCAINLLGQTYFKDFQYVLNPDYRWGDALNSIWWTLKAALFEELIFRGAILYLLIRKLGMVKGCLISAIAFGVYHWFSYGMIGGPIVPLIYIFLLTGACGWMFAYSFAKTKSLYAPLGLHFGWIAMSIVVFSDGPLGSQLFIPNGKVSEMTLWPTILFFVWQTFIIPGIAVWYISRRYTSE